MAGRALAIGVKKGMGMEVTMGTEVKMIREGTIRTRTAMKEMATPMLNKTKARIKTKTLPKLKLKTKTKTKTKTIPAPTLKRPPSNLPLNTLLR